MNVIGLESMWPHRHSRIRCWTELPFPISLAENQQQINTLLSSWVRWLVMAIDGTTYDRRFSFSSTYIRVVHYNWCNVSVSSSNIWIYFIPYYLLNCNLLFRQFHPNWCPIHICTCNTGMSIICSTCQYGTFGTHSYLHSKTPVPLLVSNMTGPTFCTIHY